MKPLHSTFLLFILAIGLTFPTQAQFLSDNGLFEVDVNRGCSGTTIQITNLYTATCDCTAGCSCDFDYNGDGNFEVKPIPFEYTYNSPGIYRLEILFSGTSDFITITIEDKPAPEFEIYSCAGQVVQVNVTDINYESYEIDYGDGTVVVINQGDPIPSHSYPDNTTRTIAVRGLDNGSANNCPVATRDVNPLATLPSPSITSISPIDPVSLDIGFTTQDNILYDLRMSENNGPFSSLATYTSAITSETITGLDLENNYYCFQLVAVDPCGGPDSPSAVACSILLNVTPGNSTANLDWQTGVYTSDVSIFRSSVLLTTEPNGTTSYNDTNLVCGISYCYEVQVDFSGAISTSLQACIDSDSDIGPPPINNLSTIVRTNGGIDLRWYIDEPIVLPAIYEGFEVYRNESGSLYDIIADVKQVTFIDQEATNFALNNYCYEIVPRDYCGNRTPSNVTACIIILQGEINVEDQVALHWNPYTGYINGVNEYIIEKSYGGALAELTRVTDTTFVETDTNPDSQQLIYRITAVPNDNSIRASISQTLILYKSNNLYYPDAFSPDGDSLNDLFEVNARFIEEYELMIFNRWGELIFHTGDITESWDGKVNGKNVPEGIYVMKVKITDESGTVTRKEGSITVVRR